MSTTRPKRLVVVAGTATEVGKTWVTCRLLELLCNDGRSVAVRKPVQSFDQATSGAPLVTDADLLALAANSTLDAVCPPHRWYPRAMAPPIAAAAVGSPPILVEELLGEVTWPDAIDVGFVETAGGVRSPIADDADCVEFAQRLRPDLVILVADAGLGTINSVRLSLAALAHPSLEAVVFLNRFDPEIAVHHRNLDWLRTRDGLTVHADLFDLARRCER